MITSLTGQQQIRWKRGETIGTIPSFPDALMEIFQAEKQKNFMEHLPCPLKNTYSFFTTGFGPVSSTP